MKKIRKYLAIASLALAMILGMNAPVFAAEATLTASASTVRAGDTITLSLKIPQKGCLGFSGTLDYDSSKVSLLAEPSTKLSDWVVERSENDLVVYDNNQSNPLKGSETVMTLKFKVKSDVAEGTPIKISIKNIVVSDGNSDKDMGTAVYSVTVSRSLSGNANLSELSISGSTLSPEFKASTTSYNIGEVDYNVKALDIKYACEDANAKVSVKGNSLSVGKNTVTIVVTAENGTQKTYKISVTRKQDPNYVAGANANLKSLSVSSGILSPSFASDVTDYIVYLPYEAAGTAFSASGKEADAKAQGVIAGSIDKLAEGKNRTSVVCKAEDGTEKIYSIVVFVMPKYDGTIPSIGGETATPDPEPLPVPDTKPGDTELPTEKPSEFPTETTTEPSTDNSTGNGTVSNTQSGGGNVLPTVLVVLIVIALVGALVYVLFFAKKR